MEERGAVDTYENVDDSRKLFSFADQRGHKRTFARADCSDDRHQLAILDANINAD